MTTTGNEVRLPEGYQLVSTTDLKGRITYANPIFCKIAGYSKEELIGKAHSIVRHPDMPKAAFANLWVSIEQDKPWRGLVKNRCKNGDYYWVDAYVTALYENGQKIGYQSVRCKPDPQAVQKAEKLYARFREGKPPSLKIANGSFSVVIASLFFVISCVLSYLLAREALPALWIWLMPVLISGLVVMFILQRGKMLRVQKVSSSVCDNALIQKVFSEKMDMEGAVDIALQMQEARNRTVLGRLRDISVAISHSVDISDKAILRSSKGILQQDAETDMVAAAVAQLSASAEEIARNTEDTSEHGVKVLQQAGHGRRNLDNTTKTIEELSADVARVADEVTSLREHALAIGEVVNVINDIAEQTNLLALNAAIEAARAGDQGRGFAVVSDEVRTLANRTQASTLRIRETIERLQCSVESIVELMAQGRHTASTASEKAQLTADVFNLVEDAINGISERCAQIASSAEQQSMVVDEVHKNVEAIRNLAAENREGSEQTTKASKVLHGLITQLDLMVTAFDR